MTLDKTALRRKYALLRESLAPAERDAADAAIRDRLSRWRVFRDAPAVAAFAALGAEPELAELAADKHWFLPRWSSAAGAYEIVEVGDPGRDLVRGRYGIREPRPELPALPESSWRDLLFLVPAVACGLDGTRLGRGGGYYDRMLAESVYGAAAVVYDCQVASEALPCEEHDRRVGWIVTEDRLIECGNGCEQTFF